MPFVDKVGNRLSEIESRKLVLVISRSPDKKWQVHSFVGRASRQNKCLISKEVRAIGSFAGIMQDHKA